MLRSQGSGGCELREKDSGFGGLRSIAQLLGV